MKQTLPWSVTGIPPQARELARAAAARDGLSVGDWLTRRIYLESQQELEETRPAPGSQSDQNEHSNDAPLGHDRIMHQLARMEGATESALRRIDETLRTLARSGERSSGPHEQSGISDRMDDKKTDILPREQAQGMNQLVRRVENVERNADTATLRKAMRGLHQGVSRLAEQVAKNEISTTNRIEALAGNLDAVSKSVKETRANSGYLAKDLEERLSALTEQIARSEELLDSADARVQNAVEVHVSAFERKMKGMSERLDRTERVRDQQERSIEETLKGLEKRLGMVERRSQETGSEFRLSLEEIRARLDAAENAPDHEGEEQSAAINDDTPIPLPGMGQALAPQAEDQKVTNAVERFLSVARRSTNPAIEDGEGTGRLALASARADRKEEPRDKESTPLRRVLPVLSVGLLLAAGAGYLIVSGFLASHGASAEPARASTPPTVDYALEAGAAAPSSDADLFSTTWDDNGPEKTLPEGGPADEHPGIIAWDPSTAGEDPPADPARAISWYQEAARSGHRGAMHNLAVAYANGIGIEKNLAEASRWFRSAAELGFADSQFNLAVLYERGLGVPMSLNEAYKWYLAASRQGDTEAQARAELLSKQLPEEQRIAVERATTIHAAQPLKGAANDPPTLAQLQ